MHDTLSPTVELPSLITRTELARFLKNSKTTLVRWQAEGFGPKSFRIGRVAYYKAADVLAFIEERYLEAA